MMRHLAVSMLCLWLVICAFAATCPAGGPPFTLSIESKPFSGIRIAGSKPGVSPYRCPCNPGDTFTLTAPETAMRGDQRYRFVRWAWPGGEQNERSLEQTITSSRTITAEYELLQHKLSVDSTPTKVSMQGTRPGITGYSAQCEDREHVLLLPPPEFRSTEGIFVFAHWEVNGQVVPPTSPVLELEMNAPAAALLVYSQRMHTLSVQVAGGPDVSILGTVAGTTPYAATCAAGQMLQLEAPTDTKSGNTRYRFVCWLANGRYFTQDGNILQLDLLEDTETVAIYEPLRHPLRVETDPFGPVAIGGTRPGNTRYNVDCIDGEVVLLTAPPTAICNGAQWRFAYWSIDSTQQPDGEAEVQFTISGGITARAVYEQQRYWLVVQSEPCTASIDGSANGHTNFQTEILSGQEAYLLAPPNVSYDGHEYVFVRWTGDGVVDGLDVRVWMNADKQVTALYRLRPQFLTVNSTPFHGVRLSGDTTAMTDCMLMYNNRQMLNIEAPAAVMNGEQRWNFVRWSGAVASTEPGIELLMDNDKIITAEYQIVTHELTVRSEPIGQVPVFVRMNTQTVFIERYKDMETAYLWAAPTVERNGTIWDFSHWRIDQMDHPAGQVEVHFDMDAAHTATAVYAERMHTLTVLSSPLPGVQMGGTHPGTATYTAQVGSGKMAELLAPPQVTAGIRKLQFAFWVIDNQPQPVLTPHVFVLVDRDCSAMAVYDWRLKGDVNEDCKVDVLDLIDVRNRLGQKCSQ